MSGNENTIPILGTATPLAGPESKPNILRVEPNTTNNTWYYIKMLFLLLLITLLGLNVYYYVTEGITFFSKMFGDGIQNTERETEKGAKAIEKALETTEKKDDLEDDDDEDVKLDLKKTLKKEDRGNEKNKTVPSPDLSSHDDLENSKKQYCYVGNLGGKRSCAEIQDSDKCISGDIFPTEQICINPNLRR